MIRLTVVFSPDYMQLLEIPAAARLQQQDDLISSLELHLSFSVCPVDLLMTYPAPVIIAQLVRIHLAESRRDARINLFALF